MTEQTLTFARAHRNDDVHALLLRAAQYPDIDMAAAVTQIEGWRTAQTKLPTWAANEGIVFPPRLSMEQCSSELTASYKANLCRGRKLADLTGGFGVDCAFMSEGFDEVTYVERNVELCAISSGNFAHLGLSNIHTVEGDGTAVLSTLSKQDWIYLDPARRDGAGRKVVALADCEPDVTVWEGELLNHAERVMVKCSPMLDITLACRQLHTVSSVHVVAVQNECKELLLILDPQHEGQPVIHAIDLATSLPPMTFTPDEEQNCNVSYTEQAGHYLYEPGAALLKAGCVKLTAKRWNLQKLHPNTQLYTSDQYHADFPGRTFEVIGTTGFGKHELKALTADLTSANITVRNFPDSVDTLRKRLHLSDGGTEYLFATTLSNGQHQLIRCHKVQKES